MSFQQVTLGHEDIEFFDPIRDELRASLRSQVAFDAWCDGLGVEKALLEVTRLHREIANQLIRRAEKDPTSSDWAARAIGLCGVVRWRRNQVRRLYVEQFGLEALRDFLRDFKVQFPRAEWASGLTATELAQLELVDDTPEVSSPPVRTSSPKGAAPSGSVAKRRPDQTTEQGTTPLSVP